MIFSIDHFVLTVRSVEETCRFYERVLGLECVSEPGKPTALKFGDQKINVHEIGHTFEPKAAVPTLGAGDFCLITVFPIDEVQRRLKECGVTIELGPIQRTGAQGEMMSIYFRDPDGNLVEVSRYNGEDSQKTPLRQSQSENR
jgi:catechol 2,3-dioxygenase-like lactoylglutathione lyase family enzyme